MNRCSWSIFHSVLENIDVKTFEKDLLTKLENTLGYFTVIGVNLTSAANFLNYVTNPIYLATLVIISQDGALPYGDWNPVTAGRSDEWRRDDPEVGNDDFWNIETLQSHEFIQVPPKNSETNARENGMICELSV